MKITNASTGWLSVTTTRDEVWQLHSGAVVVDTDATEGDRLGIILEAAAPRRDSITFGAGVTVYYKLWGGVNSATIARVAVRA